MPASNLSTDTAQAWTWRAERARRIAVMLSAKDAAATEAYARECEVKAWQALERLIERPTLPPLAA
jgi:hypothetical protein